MEENESLCDANLVKCCERHESTELKDKPFKVFEKTKNNCKNNLIIATLMVYLIQLSKAKVGPTTSRELPLYQHWGEETLRVFINYHTHFAMQHHPPVW